MSEPAPTPARPPTRLERILYGLGAIGLLGAMSTDSIAVVGRRIQMPLLGSVEIVQAFVVIAASTAMLAATLAREHAGVRVLVERMPRLARGALSRLANLLFGAFFLVLAGGSGWIMWELRNGAEMSELVGIPIAALRGVATVCAAMVAFLFFKRALSPKERAE